ncbi:glycosyltransferase family 2 protein [Candidatus Galacturonibacter soehngenii]|uniref:cellulose synthase (UDP-forming) n=1 Tax=Candidatus Galacturonatibacter soehngenii TaxID=2307010 RepID=A0A7V7QJN0_9FIRM|nr:glycosyltransferase [Candidatus Galacturonibacter soehngenii]KAB1437858.1 glycosyltransferase [Candidatus Galacturonibacter soehngenii]
MKPVIKKLLVFFTILSSVIYILWRTFRTLPFQYGIISTICGISLLIVEIIGFFEMVVHFSQLSNIYIPKRPEIEPSKYPDVDVFISTYNEPPELLYKTINACLHMDYPDKSKVHIYLCDDGHREEMGVLARKMGVTHLVRDTHQFAKAGNLNHALSVTSSPYIVTFDADMMPRHNFLTNCMPYLLGEEKVGFLQTPQTFYNPDLFQYNLYSEDRIPNEQDYFYRDVQVMRNASNTVIYGGTNTILSREALEAAGGFYTGVITEDFATGMVIQSKGYQCYAINESYACGMAPEDLKSLIKQRQRWARGCIQTGRKVNILFQKGLNLNQKLSYLTSITYWYGALKRFIYIMSPILYAVFNVIVVKCTLWEILLFWLPMYLLNNTTLRLLSGNIRNTRLTNIYETILFPSLLPAVLLETFGISQRKFVVTKKDSKQKLSGSGVWYRFKQSILLFVLLGFSVLGLTKCVIETFRMGTPMYVVIMFWLLVNLFNLLMALFFMFGRQPHRQFERFDVEVDCLITYGNRMIRTKTVNISEKGISVALNFPEWISPKEEVIIKLATNQYETSFKARVANVMSRKDKWMYGFEMLDITEKDNQEMLQIVYDREPSLPKEIEAGLSTVDDIMINIWRRTGGRDYFSRKLPRVELMNYVETIEGNRVLLRDFNYEFLTIQFLRGTKIPTEITLVEQGIKIDCILEDKNAKFGSCYRIKNENELIHNTKFRAVLKSWMYDCEIDVDEKTKYHKKLDHVLKKYEYFDELNYL